MHSRLSSSSLALAVSGSYDENNRTCSTTSILNGENNSVDHSRITMKTRVAVRDHTPHRFQVVPLRDVGQLLVTRKDTVSKLVLPSTPLNSILKAPSGRLNPPCLQNLQTLSTQPSSQGLNSSQPPKGMNTSTKSSNSDTTNIYTNTRRRERDRVQSVGETRPILVEVDLNLTPNRRSVKSDNLSHLSVRTNRRFITIQQHLPSKTNSHRVELEPCTINSQIDDQSPGANESLHCLLSDGLSASHALAKDRKPKKDAPMNLVKKVTFDLNHQNFPSSVDSVVDEPRSKKRHAIYTQSLLVPYFYDIESSDGPPMDVASESSTSVECHSVAQGPSFLFQGEPCDPLKNGDWLAFLDDSNETEYLCIPGKSLLEEPFELKPTETEQQIAAVPKLCLESTTVAPLNFVPRLLNKSAYGGETVDRKGINYSDIILDIFADIDKAIEGWQ